jgi:hypothetical protein
VTLRGAKALAKSRGSFTLTIEAEGPVAPTDLLFVVGNNTTIVGPSPLCRISILACGRDREEGNSHIELQPRSPMHRTLIPILVLVSLLALAVAACGGSSPSTPASPTPAPTAPAGTWVDNEPTLVGTLAGNPNVGNTFPFGNAPSATFASTMYQQAYLASQFGTTPIRFTRLEFFRVMPTVAPLIREVVAGDYVFSLSTTTKSVEALDPVNFAGNIGTDARTVFSTRLGPGSIVNDVLSIAFSSRFTYTPANGNLLLQIERSGASPPSTSVAFLGHTPNDGFPPGLSWRVSNYGGNSPGFYLVTRFHHQRCVCPTTAPCTCPG